MHILIDCGPAFPLIATSDPGRSRPGRGGVWAAPIAGSSAPGAKRALVLALVAAGTFAGKDGWAGRDSGSLTIDGLDLEGP